MATFAPQNTYAQMLGMADATTPNMNPLRPGMDSVTDPNAAAPLAAMHRPVQNPAELEARKSGWAQVAEKLSDPNVLRALGFAGAAMAQPGGTVGHGLASGMTAFQAGEYAQREQGIQDQILGMRKEEHAAGLEATRASTDASRARTATEQARLPGVESQTRQIIGTEQIHLEDAKTALETAKVRLASAKSKQEVDDAEFAVRRRRAEISKTIPSSKMRDSLLAEMDKAINDAAAAREKLAGARADRGLKETELRAIKDLPPEELRQFFTRTGKYAAAATSSRIVQEAAIYGDLYDKIKKQAPDAPEIKGVTREQFQLKMVSGTKAKDITDMMKNYVLAGGDDPEILKMFSDILRTNLESKPGAPEPAAKQPGDKTAPGWSIRRIE